MPSLRGLQQLCIKPSIYISGLCHSIFKLEPYTSCSHMCAYCYARWYRAKEISSTFHQLAKQVKAYARLTKASEKILPLRMSTLIDPFQPIEEQVKASYKLMKLALKLKIPLIVSTKSILYVKSPWRDLLKSMAEEHLILLQVSLSTLDGKASSLLEPNAPLPKFRVEAAKQLSDHVPLVARIQPYMPGITDLNGGPYELIKVIKEAGFKQVIVELIRLTPDDLHFINELLSKISLRLQVESWEPYGVRGENLLRPSLKDRVNVLKLVKEACQSVGLKFSTCKEGLLNLHEDRDCCGFSHIGLDKVGYRLTLYDMYLSSEANIEEVVEKEKLIAGSMLTSFRGFVKKCLRGHEKRLKKLLASHRELYHVAPVFKDKVPKMELM
ncbi:MAG: hypothetical protein DRJ31_08395 [Candidatus Methanomethylicota archaeon]|uniref:Radical SAM core domain-containing protein n=1 Tax=Thermoproteota archaeon TaxID=2056631 RepID=A0A497EN20_9CREN|nr:MAG: hypothetical protein DRJ31_08395 [Candidatus Verstraetearchaeota archaeon]